MNIRPSATSTAFPTLRIAPTRADALKNLLLLLSAHASLLAFFLAAFTLPRGLWLLAAAPVACLLHQKAMSEWLHEGAHWNFAPSRAWNDRLVQWLAGTLFLEGIDEHRRRHFTHHRRKGFFVDEDLDTASLAATSRRDVVRGILRDLTGITALAAISGRRRSTPERSTARGRGDGRSLLLSVTLYVSVTVLLALFGPAWSWSAAPLYLTTLATIYPVFNRLRVYAQHAELGEHGAILSNSTASRTIRVDRLALVDRVFVSSKVMLFHSEHHANPTLPFRQLEQLAAAHEDVNRYATSRLGLLSRLFRELPD